MITLGMIKTSPQHILILEMDIPRKKIRASFGESQIQVPRDRDASFNPMIVPKRENMVDGIENIIVSLYAKGMHQTYSSNVDYAVGNHA